MPKRYEVSSAISSFSGREKKFFVALVILLLVSTLGILESINTSFMTSVAKEGGRLSEGVIGTPRFINPVLASSLADLDMVSLVYSGLMRKNPDGTLSPDLAESYEMSPDGLTYTFLLKEGLVFHDEAPLTASDVVFTINQVKDPVLKSPRKIQWDGIMAEEVDSRTVKFTLRQPVASFLENATIGIMPEALWRTAPIELHEANTNPIGSGPFKITKVGEQDSGSIDYYELESFKDFALGKPYIKKITMRFYGSEEDLLTALQNKEVDQASSLTPLNAEILKAKGYRVESATLPRIFGLFFNQTQNQIFTDKNVIVAINEAIDKDRIVREVLDGYGVVINTPVPPSMSTVNTAPAKVMIREERLAKASEILSKAGWTKNAEGFLEKTTTKDKKKTTAPLQFSISTGNAPELAHAAELVKEDLQALGMQVDVKTFEVGNLNQGVIRPRKYDVLLFGQIINQESDLFAFWHSSQRKDPGLNVSMYTNAKVDKILEDAFVTIDEEERIKKYAQFEEEVKKDMPAVFLYSPNLLYVVSEDLKELALENITAPKDRFSNAHLWYIDTEDVWKVFASN